MSYNPIDTLDLSKKADKIISKYPNKKSAIMPLLHLVQSVDGYVSENGIEFIADVLGIEQVEVKSISSFYSMFREKSAGKYVIGVCKTALCAVMGGDQILKKLSEYLSLKPGETSSDGMFTLEEIECNAACDYAPVVMLNWEFMDNQSPKKIIDTVKTIQSKKSVNTTRKVLDDTKIKEFKKIAFELSGI
jgi:NADH-quinone oxidoreductase subunit E